MPSRAIWTGAISFGLVNIPVKLYTAVREERVQFHMLSDQDGSRLKRKMVSVSDGREVHPEHIVKGYEIGPDQYVVIREEELEAIAPTKTRTIEIHDFVDLAQIDPVYYDRPYYLLPFEHGAKAYRLLVEAMEKAKKVGIAKFVLRDREHLAAIRPVDGILLLVTMRFAEEVVPPQQVGAAPVKAKADDREVKMAQQLIDTLATGFRPDRYRDEYASAVKDLIERKAKGEQVVTQPPAAPQAPKAANLLSALEASIAAARAKSGAKGETTRAQTRRRKPA